MALFKILRGSSDNLNNQTFHDGYCYFTTDTGLFYIDYLDGNVEKRIPIKTQNSTAANALVSQNGVQYKLWVGDTVDLPPEDERDPYTIYFTNDEEGGGEITALDVSYDSETSGLSAGNTQVAIDKLAQSAKNLASDIETIDEGLITITNTITTIGNSVSTIEGDITSLKANKQNLVDVKTADMVQPIGRDENGKLFASNVFDGLILKDTQTSQLYVVEI